VNSVQFAAAGWKHTPSSGRLLMDTENETSVDAHLATAARIETIDH
jgi:hypothetical protein